MRALVLASMTALLLSGLPPTPPEPAAAQSRERVAAPEDPDRLCAPFIEGFAENRDYFVGGAAGRGRGVRNAPLSSSPPPPPPPSPPPPPPPPLLMPSNRSAKFHRPEEVCRK